MTQRDGPPQPQDIRAYSPTTYEDLHHTCGVNIGKSVGHGNAFGGATHNSEAVIDPNAYPGWGPVGRKSDWPRAPKTSSLARPVDRQVAAKQPSSRSPERCSTGMGANHQEQDAAAGGLPDEPSGIPLRADDLFSPKGRKVKSKPKLFAAVGDSIVGGVIPRETGTRGNRKANDVPCYSERAGLDVKLLARHTPGVPFAASTSLRSIKEKPSDRYQRMLQASPSPTPAALMKSTSASRAGSSMSGKGYAPCRYNHRTTLNGLLGQTACDVLRAQSVMESCFGRRSRSSLRQDALYTPQPDEIPRELSP
jgi:hypothetical protein